VRSLFPLTACLALASACGGTKAANTSFTPAALVAGEPAIPYPPDLYAEHVQGEVLLYLVVDSTGAIVTDSIRIAKSSGQTAFDSAALAAAPRLRFTPAHRGTEAVTAPIQVPITFRLPDSGAATSNE
jgi:periplasmic protein TonB